jgi:hypothetical protein
MLACRAFLAEGCRVPERRAHRAPAGLGTAGRHLWRRITEGLRLRPDELALLEAACRTADDLAALEGALRKAKPVVTGSAGQLCPNPSTRRCARAGRRCGGCSARSTCRRRRASAPSGTA